MSDVHLLAVFVENKPGQTARITKTIADAGVNIRWVTIDNSGSFGVMKFILDHDDQAAQALRQAGFMVSFLEVLAVEVPDRKGALSEVTACLAHNSVNLHNVSGFVSNNHALLLLEVHDVPRAAELLINHGLRVITREELMTL